MIFSLLLVIIGFSAGYIIQYLVNSSKIKFRHSLKQVRKSLQTLILIIVTPITIVFSIWIAPLTDIKIIALPLLCVFAILLGGFAAFHLAGPLGLNKEQRGVYTVLGGFTNLGSLGGLITFILLGEAGFALVAVYQLFEKFVYFLIGFPIAKSHSIHRIEGRSRKSNFFETLKDPAIFVNLAALILGTLLNLSGIPRPEMFLWVNKLLIPFGSVVLLVSIGMAMKFGPIKKNWLAGIVLILIKSLIVPGITFSIGYLLGLGNFAAGLALKTVLILSAMPVAFMAMIPPTLFDMDMDLANTGWFISILSMLITVPILSILITLI